jgi:hypothetical protein
VGALPYRYILGCGLGVRMFEGEWRSEIGLRGSRLEEEGV